MQKYEPRTEVVWIRISKKNLVFLKKEMKRFNTKSRSSFFDSMLNATRTYRHAKNKTKALKESIIF